jgi:sulfopyruvate decarboxylase TPP-binding subunit
LLVTWRGYQGQDAPEHIVLGRVLPDLLDLFGIPHRAPQAEALEADVAWAAARLRESAMPAALIVRPGLFE